MGAVLLEPVSDVVPRRRRNTDDPERPEVTRAAVAVLLDDGDADALDGVVHVAANVPGRLERLLVPGRVSRAATQLVLAGLGVP